MGRWHAYYARRAGARIVAVTDPSVEAATRLVGTEAAAFSDCATMLAATRPDVVHVCTPLASHFEIARHAVDAGAHVLVEKPLTPDAATTRDLVEAASARGVQACPVHQFAFQRGIARAVAALPGLGEALHARFTVHSAGGEGRAPDALEAIVADILPHPLSVLQALWPGAPLVPGDWSATRPRAGEMHVLGRCASVGVSAWISMNARPTRCDLDIACTGGGVHVNFFHGYAIVRRGAGGRADKIGQPFRAGGSTLMAAASNLARRAWQREFAYPGLEALVRAFHAAARGEAPPPVSPAQVVAVAQVRDHLLESLPGAGRG